MTRTTIGDPARLRLRPPPAHGPRPRVVLLAATTGLAVASNYYVQPLLARLQTDLHLHGATAGLIVTVGQFGYVVGLIFVLPLGDLFERRRLIVVLSVGTALALVGFALAVDSQKSRDRRGFLAPACSR